MDPSPSPVLNRLHGPDLLQSGVSKLSSLISFLIIKISAQATLELRGSSYSEKPIQLYKDWDHSELFEITISMTDKVEVLRRSQVVICKKLMLVLVGVGGLPDSGLVRAQLKWDFQGASGHKKPEKGTKETEKPFQWKYFWLWPRWPSPRHCLEGSWDSWSARASLQPSWS